MLEATRLEVTGGWRTGSAEGEEGSPSGWVRAVIFYFYSSHSFVS